MEGLPNRRTHKSTITRRRVRRAVSCLNKLAQVGYQVVRGVQRVGVVVAEHAAAAFQGVLVQVAGRPRLAKFAQVGGQVVRGVQGVGVVVAEHAAAAFDDLDDSLVLARPPGGAPPLDLVAVPSATLQPGLCRNQ